MASPASDGYALIGVLAAYADTMPTKPRPFGAY